MIYFVVIKIKPSNLICLTDALSVKIDGNSHDCNKWENLIIFRAGKIVARGVIDKDDAEKILIDVWNKIYRLRKKN
jgi:hypothetical protein